MEHDIKLRRIEFALRAIAAARSCACSDELKEEIDKHLERAGDCYNEVIESRQTVGDVCHFGPPVGSEGWCFAMLRLADRFLGAVEVNQLITKQQELDELMSDVEFCDPRPTMFFELEADAFIQAGDLRTAAAMLARYFDRLAKDEATEEDYDQLFKRGYVELAADPLSSLADTLADLDGRREKLKERFQRAANRRRGLG